MKKIFLSGLFAFSAALVLPAFLHAQENSLTNDCAHLLTVPDDTSSISDYYSFETDTSFAITYKTFMQFSAYESGALIFRSAENTKNQTTAIIFLREDPHFRYSVKLE